MENPLQPKQDITVVPTNTQEITVVPTNTEGTAQEIKVVPTNTEGTTQEILGQIFAHKNPVLLEKCQYFYPPPNPEKKKLICIIVPFYNEEWKPLYKTLASLNECQRLMEQKYLFTYLLIQDGWQHVSDSMAEGLKAMFPGHQYWKLLDEDDKNNNNSTESLTLVFQTMKGKECVPTRIPLPTPEKGEPQDPQPPMTQEDQACFCCGSSSTKVGLPTDVLKLPIALVIKKDNRKKHNSHQWFFSEHGYCGALQPEFCFATDCSTLFKEDCIALLAEKLNKEEDCAVCTGRQVVMTATQQESKGIECVFKLLFTEV